MVAAHFGFTELPFRFTPDPRFYVETALARAAQGLLQAALQAGDPFVALLGEPGVGKSTMVARLVASLPEPPWRVVFLPLPDPLEGDAILHALANAAGVELTELHDPLALLTEVLRPHGEGARRVLVVIDDADAIDADSLQWLQHLGRPARGTASLQVLLVAQTLPSAVQDRAAGGSPLLESVVTLQPLDLRQTQHYLHGRLQQVGWRGSPAFDEATVQAIHGATHGVPGRINSLCDRLLLHLFMAGRRDLQPGDVQAVDAVQQAEWGTGEAQAARPGPEVEVRTAGPVPQSSPARGTPARESTVTSAAAAAAAATTTVANPSSQPVAANAEPVLPFSASPQARRSALMTLVVIVGLLVMAALWWGAAAPDDDTQGLAASPPVQLSTSPPPPPVRRVQGSGTETAPAASAIATPTPSRAPASPSPSAAAAGTACSPAHDAMGLCASQGAAPPAGPTTDATPGCDAARRALGLCP